MPLPSLSFRPRGPPAAVLPPPAPRRDCFLSSAFVWFFGFFFFAFNLSWPAPSEVPAVAVGILQPIPRTTMPARPPRPSPQGFTTGTGDGGPRCGGLMVAGARPPVQNRACPITVFPAKFPFSAGARSFSATVTSVGTAAGARCHRLGPRYHPAASHTSPPALAPAASLPLPIFGTNGEITWLAEGKSCPPSIASSPGRRVIARQSPCSYGRCFGKHACCEAAASSAQNRRKITERSPEDSPKTENPAGL